MGPLMNLIGNSLRILQHFNSGIEIARHITKSFYGPFINIGG